MRIVFNEVKKIFNIKSLVVVSVICFIIYKMFIDFHIEYFPNGRPNLDIYEISKMMVEEKGQSLPEGSLDYLKELEERYKEEFDSILKSNELAKELGVTTVDELSDLMIGNNHESERDKKISKLSNDIVFGENKSQAFWRLEGLDMIIGSYQNKDNEIDDYFGESAVRREEEIQSSKGYNDILPEEVFSNFTLFMFSSAGLIMISVMFLVAPIFTRDKHRKLEYLQYTSKRGRRLYKDKVEAALLSALIIVTVELFVLFALFLTRENTIEVFYNSSVNSWMNNSMIWYDFTLKEYMIFAVILIYILSFGVALIASYISRKSNRYITLIGVSMIVTLALYKLTTIETIRWNGIGNIYGQRFLVEGFILLLLVVGAGLIIFRYKKEKKISIG